MSIISRLAWAIGVLALCVPLHAQEISGYEIGLRNECSVPVDGLLIRFDSDLDPAVPVELNVGGTTTLPFSAAPQLVDARTVRFSGGTLSNGSVFPSGGPAELLRFNPALEGQQLTVVTASWLVAGVETFNIHLTRVPNHSTAGADGLELVPLSANGIPLALLGASATPNPWTPFGCGVTTQDLGSGRWGFDFGCGVEEGGFTTPLLQLTLPNLDTIEGFRIRWTAAGTKTGSALLTKLTPNGSAPAVGLRLLANQPIKSISPSAPHPLPVVVGLGTSTLDFCGTAIAPNAQLGNGQVMLISEDLGSVDLALVSTSWRSANPAPLIPDVAYFSFDEGNSNPLSQTGNMSQPFGSNPADVTGYTTDGVGQFGSGLTRRGGDENNHVSTGVATNFGSSSWTVMYWIDVTGADNPDANQYLFADELASDWRGNINGGGLWTARLAGQGMNTVLIPNAVDPLVPHHVSFVYDATVPEVRGYIDGVLAVTQPQNQLSFTPGSDLWLARHPSYDAPLQRGTVFDEFRIYGRALNSQELVEASGSFVLAKAATPLYETNDAEASLTLNDVEAAHHCPSLLQMSSGNFVTLEMNSANWGHPFDLLISPDPLVPGDAGGTILWDGQILNLDHTSPSTLFLYGGFAQPFVPTTIQVAPPAGLDLCVQMVVGAPSEPAGFALSAATQLTVTQGSGTPNIVLEASGINSYNSNTDRPYWRLTHHGTMLPISRLIIDIAQSTNGSHTSMNFDLDQSMTGAGGIIAYGNGAAPCLGTYRNGSDLAMGLIYDGLNTYIDWDNGEGCIGGNCGFIASDVASSDGHSYRRVEFRFTPGYFFDGTFEWDMDTDGGQGVAGDDMVGLHVTIELLDGTLLNGEFQVDGSQPDTSSVIF